MDLMFLYPWFAFASALVAAVGGAMAFWKRRLAPMFFILGAAAFLLAGARPQLGSKDPEVRHALIVDVSGSMATRPEVAALADSLQLPAGHSFVRYELSDALRTGGARGEGTDYTRIGDLASDASISGEIVLITDGRGALDELYSAIDPRRLILLRASPPASPDASILSLTAPTSVPSGGTAMLRATVRCDADAQIPWRVVDGADVLATGMATARAEVAATIELAQPMISDGLRRLTLLLDMPGDRERRNDEASVAIAVGEKRRIEYCVPESIPPASDSLLQLLQADAGNNVSVRHNLPTGDPAGAALVVINNLPLATSGVAREQLGVLADWANAGGSLLMVGTDGAFGPGGYRGTAIEDVMPVRFRPDDAPPRRVLLLLDTSDSMREALPGGATRLSRLKEGARRVLDSLDATDTAAVVGFRDRLQGDVAFLPARDARLVARLEGLEAAGKTHIATSLEQAIDLSIDAGTRILMVTDGEDGEGAGADRYAVIAAVLAERQLRLDIVLTDEREFSWTGWLGAAAKVWRGSFDDLLETLERVAADVDQEWVLTTPTTVNDVGAALPRLVRTATRNEASSSIVLSATEQTRTNPLLARRQLVGRSACLCTDSWGDASMAGFWGDASFQARLRDVLAFLLENAGADRLVLNPHEDGAELVWTSEAPAPAGDLQTSAGVARMDVPGRWLLNEWPEGVELRVFAADNLLQRVALPKRVPAELRLTGDDEVFFTVAEEGGLRVFRGLDAWEPRRFVQSSERPRDITWVAALAGMMLLLAGFALRRR